MVPTHCGGCGPAAIKLFSMLIMSITNAANLGDKGYASGLIAYATIF
jgi:hypothetical protein